jgi:GMP synthase (glutamine-hydrolysing)
MNKDVVLIIDFGSQYTQLIARRIRELGVYCEIHSYLLSDDTFIQLHPKAVILSGGPQSTYDDKAIQIPSFIFNAQLPILGICYGMQALSMQLGGQVEKALKAEFGHATISIEKHTPLTQHIKNNEACSVWMSHGDKVTRLPDGFDVIASSPNTPIAAIADLTRHWYGVQFHPEVTHTDKGMLFFKAFLFDIAQIKPTWQITDIEHTLIEAIQITVKDNRVILGLSGGVDSSVVAALLHRAIPNQFMAVFVDTGLLRLNEVEQVNTMMRSIGLAITTIDAKDRFYNALRGISCPEEKRKIIGHLFIDIFEEVKRKEGPFHFLAQGTIYPDRIESAKVDDSTTASHVIKSHHNVGGLPDNISMTLLEPLNYLFKDEVRKLGIQLGLPKQMIYRHPFPGPGLGVRILGEVKPQYVTILQKADAIFIEELHKSGWYDKVSQAFVVFMPIKSVGVMGDGRRYDYVVCLRAVSTDDFMTATWTALPYALLGHVSNRIINEVEGVSRVTYDISGKPPSTIEWE